ncbi:clathrin light chain 2-like [Iris pallida]|uniref:Clathrin light chain 2-like n=1 Tax=Iris pallida TaxID=29817 RepID=A0AAX6H045_IRIPA|nr:clathrin light chain 2-like [Iris pallida]
MAPEEGFVLREWRRLVRDPYSFTKDASFLVIVGGGTPKCLLLEEKERKEKELRNEIILEAEEYKRAFYEKRKLTCESTRSITEKGEASPCRPGEIPRRSDKTVLEGYSELVPNEVPTLEKKRGKKDQDKKPNAS